MKNLNVMDGNEACITAAYKFSEVCGIYPITPSSPMATLADKWSSNGKLNIFGEKVDVIEMQSEAGAAGFVHGSLQGGRLTTTFTSSQGLLLMIPSMYKIAGEMLPGVIHSAARSLSTHALSIFGDHQDVYATRQTGFCMLSSSNVQEAYYMALISHLSAIDGSLPFLHFFDGFRTSHELNKINILEDNDIEKLINYDAIKSFKNNAINIGKCITRGTSQTEDIYFQNTEVRNKYYDAIPSIVYNYMSKINELSGEDFKPFNYYGKNNAKHIIIAMGSVCDTIKEVVGDLNNNGDSVGVICVHLYRPFSTKYLLEVLPKSVERISVLDRTKEFGSVCEPLYLDIVSSFRGLDVEIVGGRYGLSSKDVEPSHIKSVFDNMNKFEMKDHFTIGITDDVTHTNLEVSDYKLNKNYKEIKIYGFGSDGMVGASKNILKVIGHKDGNYVQGYFEYDSKKSGGVTISHLRTYEDEINAPYYLTNPNLIVLSKESYLEKYDVLDKIKENGVFLLNTEKTDEELNLYMPDVFKNIIKEKNIKFFVTNANELASKYNLRGKINNIISYYILEMLGCNEADIDYFKKIIESTYADKGAEVVKANLDVLNDTKGYIRRFDISLFSDTKLLEKTDDLIHQMIDRRSNELSVSKFLKHANGTYEGGSSTSDKRKVSDNTPCWDKSKCIQCNQCAFICPHSVIKPFNISEEDIKKSPLNDNDVIPSVGEDNKKFYLGINSDNCTGCTLCSKICPSGAIGMDRFNEDDDVICDYLKENVVNESSTSKYSVKGLGFVKPMLEFPGACAGCGETVYLKTLTALYGNEIVIANATGCSSIYGASLPCTPYKVPWISSLFEDNAEFGLGLHISYKNARERIKEIIYETKDSVSSETKDLFKKYLDNINDSEITTKVKDELEHKSVRKDLKDLLDFMPSRKVWIIGGDGWAYDIGFGGLEHVLRSGEDVKVLVLDTEVYSNTGGQTSKSTRTGAVAEFSNSGKLKPKKDLFQIAMNIPNVYVASISAGANGMQTIKAFREAMEHNGPSVIIAYSPCIAHGIKGGLQNSIDEQKLLVESGYNILMRYNPVNDKLFIDSKEPNFKLYEKVFEKELRYKNLEYNNQQYKKLYAENMNISESRYNYYKSIKNKNA